MKKIFILAMLALTTAPVFAHQANEHQIIGQWECVTKYPRAYAVTKDDIHFYQNGTYTTSNLIQFNEIPFTLSYRISEKGHWKLADNLLTLSETKREKLTTEHAAKTVSELKTNSELQERDQMNIHILTEHDTADDINVFRISSFTKNNMMQEQLDGSGAIMAHTKCTRKK